MLEDLSKLFHFLCTQTYQYYKQHKIEENLDLAEDYFGMLFRYTKYTPLIVVSSEILQINLELAQLCIGIKHLDVCKALYMFLEYIFRVCKLESENEFQRVREREAVI